MNCKKSIIHSLSVSEHAQYRTCRNSTSAGESVGGSRDPQVHLDSHVYQEEEEERQETSANKSCQKW